MDITPDYNAVPASEEIQLPSPPSDAGPTVVGGFMASQNSLSQGQLSMSGTNEQILIGGATATLTGVGIFLGNAGDGTYDFRAGDPSGNYIQWDGSTAILTVTGTVNVTAGGTIGGFNVGADYVRDVANTFGLASTVTGGDDVRFWAGDTFANRAIAPFNVTESGKVSGSNFVITGATISGIVNSTATDISLLEFTQNLVFTSASATQVNWGTGTINLSNGRTFSISSGNTGTMAALTYIYLDTGVSSTVLQTTTTYSTAIGANKILIATAQNNAVAASVITFGGGQPVLDGAGNIAALSITAGSIAASTITAAKMNVTQLSAIAADLGTITAGSISINGGIASISSAGAIVAKSIQIGGTTTQFTINNSGLFNYGDGSDGSHTTSGDETLTADKYYTDLTVATGHTLNPAGYRIFCTGTLTLAGTGKISGNGNNATNASGATKGSGGAALADGFLKGTAAGGDGGNGGSNSASSGCANHQPSAPGAGTAVSNSLGSSCQSGGAGGDQFACGGAGGGAGGAATASLTKLTANWQLQPLLDIGATGSTVKYTPSGSPGGGGGGYGGQSSGGTGGSGGGGGGSGSSGRLIAIYARNIVIGASASITANGGNGGNGANGGDATGSAFPGDGGGGGSGGNGGVIVLVYNTLSNSGSVTASGGTKGTKGNGGTGGSGGAQNGTDGTNGTGGTIYQFNLSL